MNMIIRTLLSLFLLWKATALSQDIPIVTVEGDQSKPVIVTDGKGGAIIVWEDRRSYSSDIYAQSIDSSGNRRWLANGIPVCRAHSNQSNPVAIADGSGGVYIAWEDYRYGQSNVFMQRIDAEGQRIWNENGIGVAPSSSEQFNPFLTTDDSASMFVLWEDTRRNHTLHEVYAQKVAPDGSTIWKHGGMRVARDSSADQVDAAAIHDGKGGLWVVWTRIGYDVYCQHLNKTGTPGASVDIQVSSHSFWGIASLQIVGDGRGGAIMAWVTYPDEPRAYAQRISSRGDRMWGAVDIRLCRSQGYQDQTDLASDGLGGAYIVWKDYYLGICGQLIDSFGNLKWGTVGRIVCNYPGEMSYPKIVHEDSLGVIATWQDLRNGETNIYAQRLNRNGIRQWLSTGLPISIAPGLQTGPVIVSDGNRGAIIAWDDRRNPTADIFARHLDRQGHVGLGASTTVVNESDEQPVEYSVSQNYPNPFNPTTNIRFTVKGLNDVSLTIYDILGQRVRTLFEGKMEEGAQIIEWDGRDDLGRPQSTGTYIYRLEADKFVSARKMLLLK